MIKLAEILPPAETPLWRMAKQCGVDHAVGMMDFNEAHDAPWSLNALQKLQKAYAEGGFRLDVLESRPPLDHAKLGLDGRDQEIETVCDLLRNMGKLDIPVWCYEWMPVHNWLRTRTDIPARGGALVTGYRHADYNGTVTEAIKPDETSLWDNLQYFLDRILPVAEEAGVKLAMHPDDPPLSPINGIARIMRSVDNFQRLLDMAPSPMNGITLCQGNFTMMTDKLPDVIRHFGAQQKVFFVHMRDVQGTPENFVETFHDEGKTDMPACMQAYRDIGYDGLVRPDHVPTMEGDDNSNAGYSDLGRLFALGYIKGLQAAVYS